MRASGPFGPVDEQFRIEAADWFARMRGPDAEAARQDFEVWASVPEHKHAYQQIVGRWEQSAFIGSSRVGRERHLARARFVARHPALSAAAALIALVGAGALLVHTTQKRDPVVAAARESAEQAYAAGASIRDIMLSDGSQVTLDQASQIFVAYSPSERLIRLARGRARFRLAPDPSRPVTVEAGGFFVSGEDTAFDVVLVNRAALVRAVSGSVVVRSPPSGAPHLILAHEQLIARTNASISGPTPVVPGTGDWLPRMIALQHASLADAALQVGRDARHQLLFLDDASALQITGSFTSGDTDGLARAAQALFHLVRTRDRTGNILLARTRKTPRK